MSLIKNINESQLWPFRISKAEPRHHVSQGIIMPVFTLRSQEKCSVFPLFLGDARNSGRGGLFAVFQTTHFTSNSITTTRTMNLNHPKQNIRECKHSSTQPMSVEFTRCRPSQQLYSFSFDVKPGSSKHGDAVRSRSIPIGKTALRRSASELKLTEDEAMADFQDYVFFSRLLTGITKQQQESVSDEFLQESDECLAHIIGTRNGSLDKISVSPGGAISYYEDPEDLSSRYHEEKDDGIFLMDW